MNGTRLKSPGEASGRAIAIGSPVSARGRGTDVSAAAHADSAMAAAAFSSGHGSAAPRGPSFNVTARATARGKYRFYQYIRPPVACQHISSARNQVMLDSWAVSEVKDQREDHTAFAAADCPGTELLHG